MLRVVAEPAFVFTGAESAADVLDYAFAFLTCGAGAADLSTRYYVVTRKRRTPDLHARSAHRHGYLSLYRHRGLDQDVGAERSCHACGPRPPRRDPQADYPGTRRFRLQDRWGRLFC